MFVPRLEAPDVATNPYYRQIWRGGYNHCSVPMPNCFSGDTEIVTRDGVVRLDSIVGKDILAFSKGGVYRPAKGIYCGKQPVYRIAFINGQSFVCTGNHRWIAYKYVTVKGKRSLQEFVKTTLELSAGGWYIPYFKNISSDMDIVGIQYTRIKCIEDLHCTQDVYCIQEPETHTMVLNGGILTGQCTFYATGRFMEVMGADSCNLKDLNGGEYWGYTADGYERGQTPQLGAIICWRRPGAAGHVAVVEQINSDGSIVTSNSAYNSTFFYTQTLSPPDYTWSSQYILQGFIYNPKGSKTNGSKIQGFIEEAKSHVGKFASALGLSIIKPCSAEYVRYCASKIPDLINQIIPDTDTPSQIAKVGEQKKYGGFLPGPAYNREPKPQPGDIMLLRDSLTRKFKAKTDCDRLAIVCEVEDNVATVVQLTPLNHIELGKYKRNSKQICGYYRPKWSKVDNAVGQTVGFAKTGKFYDTENTAEDATIREVAYISKNEPTTSRSDIKLSVINYTTLLSAFLDDLLVPSVYSGNVGENVITDGITDKNAKIVIDFLIEKGLNAAAACGIAGNIEHESHFNTASIGDNGTSFGICQWHYGRGDAMKQMAGSGWNRNLSGQLEYLWYELQNAYNPVLSKLMAVANNESGVRNAADIFVRGFEIPANIDQESQNRQETALKFWGQIVIQMTTTSTASSSVVGGAGVMSGTAIDIPNNIIQAGISAIYTNYIAFRWAYNQGKVFDMWNAAGRKSNRHIATLNGYYLIAVKPIFGKVGDKMSVILNDGTVINAIMADAKGAENGTSGAALYGHNQGGRINVLEWEAFDGTTGNYVRTPPDLSGWEGKTVKKIINGGSIL